MLCKIEIEKTITHRTQRFAWFGFRPTSTKSVLTENFTKKIGDYKIVQKHGTRESLISLHWCHSLNSIKPIKQSHTYIHTLEHATKRNPRLIVDQFSECQGKFERRDPPWLILQRFSCNLPSYHSDRLQVSWIPSFQYIKVPQQDKKKILYYSNLIKKL